LHSEEGFTMEISVVLFVCSLLLPLLFRFLLIPLFPSLPLLPFKFLFPFPLLFFQWRRRRGEERRKREREEKKRGKREKTSLKQ
jgi:hypothetical protein